MNSNKHKLLLAISELTEEECYGFIKYLEINKEPKSEVKKLGLFGVSHCDILNDTHSCQHENWDWIFENALSNNLVKRKFCYDCKMYIS